MKNVHVMENTVLDVLNYKTKSLMKCIKMPHTDLNTCTRNARITIN